MFSRIISTMIDLPNFIIKYRTHRLMRTAGVRFDTVQDRFFEYRVFSLMSYCSSELQESRISFATISLGKARVSMQMEHNTVFL